MEGIGGSNGSPPNMHAASSGDWKSKLHPVARSRAVDKIMEALGRHMLYTGPVISGELWKTATRVEEQILAAAADQADYFKRITVQSVLIGARTQYTGNVGQTISNATNQNTPEEWIPEKDTFVAIGKKV